LIVFTPTKPLALGANFTISIQLYTPASDGFLGPSALAEAMAAAGQWVDSQLH
jgi:hypothetical protein